MSDEKKPHKPFDFESDIKTIDRTKNTIKGDPKVIIKTSDGTVNITKDKLKIELKEGKRYRFTGNWLAWAREGKSGESMWANEIGEPINVCREEVSHAPGTGKPDYDAMRTNAMATGHALSNATMCALIADKGDTRPMEDKIKVWYDKLRPVYDKIQLESADKMHTPDEEIGF